MTIDAAHARVIFRFNAGRRSRQRAEQARRNARASRAASLAFMMILKCHRNDISAECRAATGYARAHNISGARRAQLESPPTFP